MDNREFIKKLNHQVLGKVYVGCELDEILNIYELEDDRRKIVEEYLMQLENTSITEAEERRGVQNLEDSLLEIQDYKNLEIKNANRKGMVAVAIPLISTTIGYLVGCIVTGEPNEYFVASGVGVGAVSGFLYLAVSNDKPQQEISMSFEKKDYEELRTILTETVINKLDDLDSKISS